jgi:2-polyprenyl-6-methoxyphenol hydroxylase-like FAD-dependent oxidoreductase
MTRPDAPDPGPFDRTHPRPPRSVSHVDVVIVGAGLGGALAAAILARAGYAVALVDVHAVYPPDFRVEKIAGEQVALMRGLGFLDALAGAATRVDEIVNVASGRVIDRTRGEHYSIMYGDIVRIARAQIPPSVKFMVGRVADIETSPERQRVTISGGDVIDARLVVLATGQGDVLRQKLGIRRRMVFPKHTLSFGFSVRPGPGAARFPALTYYGEHPRDRIDYLTLLPLADSLRANIFTFCDHRDRWARAFRDDPKRLLLEVMPGLAHFLPDFEVVGKVQLFMMDLSTVEDHVRDGTVLIGDAFQTSCPAAGTGVSRLLVDVDRLCNTYLPEWLATPGMGADKIARFYADPAKRAADARARRAAEFRRALTLETNLKWELRRREMYLRRRTLGWITQRLRRPSDHGIGSVRK